MPNFSINPATDKRNLPTGERFDTTTGGIYLEADTTFSYTMVAGTALLSETLLAGYHPLQINFIASTNSPVQGLYHV